MPTSAGKNSGQEEGPGGPIGGGARALHPVTDGYLNAGAGRYALWWGTVLHGNTSQALITAIGNLYADMNGVEAGERGSTDFPQRVARILQMCDAEHVAGDGGRCFDEGATAGRCRHGYEYPVSHVEEYDMLGAVMRRASAMPDEDLSAYVRELRDKLDEPFSAVVSKDYMAGLDMNGQTAADTTEHPARTEPDAPPAVVRLCAPDGAWEYDGLPAVEAEWVETFLDTVHTVVPAGQDTLGDEALFARGVALWAAKSWAYALRDGHHLDGARYLALRSFDGQLWLAAAVISRSQQLTLSLTDYCAVVLAAGLVHDYWGTKRARSSNGHKDFTRFEGTWHQGRLHYLLMCLCSYMQQTGDDRHVVLSQMILGHLYGALVIPNYQVRIEMNSHGAMEDDEHATSLFRRVACLLHIPQDVVARISTSKAARWADAGAEVTLLCQPQLQPCTSSQLGIWTHYGYLPALRMSREFCAALSGFVCCLINCEIESKPDAEARYRGISFEQYLSTRQLAGRTMGGHYTVREAEHAIAAGWKVRSSRTHELGVTSRQDLSADDIDNVCGLRWIDGLWEPQVSIGQTAGLSRIDTVRGRLGQMEMFEAAWTDRRRQEDSGMFIPLDNLLSDTGQVDKMRVAWTNIAKVVYHEDSPEHRNLNYVWALQYLGWAGARMT